MNFYAAPCNFISLLSSKTSMLEFRGFSKNYQQRRVLDFGDLQLPGGISWLMGGNGVGKTTLLRCIAGILDFKGHIALNGIDLGKEPIAYRLRVNFGEAEPLYPGFLKGIELVRFFAEAKKAPKGQANELIALFQARAYMEEPVSTYSSGMAKKLSLILAFLGNPQLILLDEPLITLDVAAQATLKLLIREISLKNVQFIVSSHQELDMGTDLPINRWKIQEGKLLLNQ